MVFRSVSMVKKMTIDTLMSLTPYNDHGQDVASLKAQEVLINHLTRQPCVQCTFFANTKTQHNNNIQGAGTNGRIQGGGSNNIEVHDIIDIEELAKLYVCQALCRNQDGYKIFTMLEERTVEDKLKAIYKSLRWKKLGFFLYSSVFLDVVCDKRSRITFRNFTNDDRKKWAQKLMAEVRRPEWVKHTLRRIVQCRYTEDDYNRDMNVLFVKLHLLDPKAVMPMYQFLQQEKALPELRLELATRNYLDGELDWHLIQPYIQQAIQQESLPVRTSRLSLDEIEAHRGVAVIKFISTEAKDYWTGKLPENKRMSKFHERCSIM